MSSEGWVWEAQHGREKSQCRAGYPGHHEQRIGYTESRWVTNTKWSQKKENPSLEELTSRVFMEMAESENSLEGRGRWKVLQME